MFIPVNRDPRFSYEHIGFFYKGNSGRAGSTGLIWTGPQRVNVFGVSFPLKWSRCWRRHDIPQWVVRIAQYLVLIVTIGFWPTEFCVFPRFSVHEKSLLYGEKYILLAQSPEAQISFNITTCSNMTPVDSEMILLWIEVVPVVWLCSVQQEIHPFLQQATASIILKWLLSFPESNFRKHPAIQSLGSPANTWVVIRVG